MVNKLVAELETLHDQTRHDENPFWTIKCGALHKMIREVRAGKCHNSSQVLRKLGFPELAMRIEQGEFDE